jgi:hypothetical protein
MIGIDDIYTVIKMTTIEVPKKRVFSGSDGSIAIYRYERETSMFYLDAYDGLMHANTKYAILGRIRKPHKRQDLDTVNLRVTREKRSGDVVSTINRPMDFDVGETHGKQIIELAASGEQEGSKIIRLFGVVLHAAQVHFAGLYKYGKGGDASEASYINTELFLLREGLDGGRMLSPKSTDEFLDQFAAFLR